FRIDRLVARELVEPGDHVTQRHCRALGLRRRCRSSSSSSTCSAQEYSERASATLENAVLAPIRRGGSPRYRSGLIEPLILDWPQRRLELGRAPALAPALRRSGRFFC